MASSLIGTILAFCGCANSIGRFDARQNSKQTRHKNDQTATATFPFDHFFNPLLKRVGDGDVARYSELLLLPLPPTISHR